MDSGGMEMVEQKEPLLPATPAPLDQGHLSEVVIHQKVGLLLHSLSQCST